MWSCLRRGTGMTWALAPSTISPLPHQPPPPPLPSIKTHQHTKHTSLAPRMMVAICDRSPHSARKVKVKDSRKMVESIPYQKWRPGVRMMPVSRSCTGVFCRSRWRKQHRKSSLSGIHHLADFVIRPPNLKWWRVWLCLKGFQML